MQVNFSVPLDQASNYRGMSIPTNIIKLLSENSSAENCFVHQKFSQNLQVYLVNYVLNISSFYDIPG